MALLSSEMIEEIRGVARLYEKREKARLERANREAEEEYVRVLRTTVNLLADSPNHRATLEEVLDALTAEGRSRDLAAVRVARLARNGSVAISAPVDEGHDERLIIVSFVGLN